MQPKSLTPRLPFQFVPARLALALLAGTLGIILASPALALAQGPPDTDHMTTVSTGLYHTCGLKTDGFLACWGYDGYGQVSGPNASADTFSQVSAGGHHTCGVKADGSLACWGNDGYGQVSGPNASPDTFSQVSAGGSHICGLKTDGSLACWGNDGYGQVSGPNISADTFTQVSAGLYHTCGLRTDGSLACWGYDWYGQVAGPNASAVAFTQVSAGGYHTCGLKTDGTLACWGHDWYGQVWGPNHASGVFTQISAGLYHTCGLETGGTLACWGYNGNGQVSGPNASPDLFIQVAAGGYHTGAVNLDGILVGWGNNDYGQAPPSNRPPTEITLSNDHIDENQPLNTEFGFLTSTDPNVNDTHTYTLVSTAACPGPDNASFNIEVDRLRTSTLFDYETKHSYTICIRADDGNGGTYAEQFIVHVDNVDEAPTNTVPAAQHTTPNTALVFSASHGTLIATSDVDAGANPVQVTLGASNGSLTLNGTSGLIFSAGDGTDDPHMVFTGTIASINTALDGMSFSPALDYIGATTVHIVTDDQGSTGAGGPLTDSDSVDIIVDPMAPNTGLNRIFLPLITVNASVPATSQ